MKKLNLSIPKPCAEDWNKMDGRDRGRFCNSCSKTVIDFTQMSDRDIVAFFKKKSDNVCGRFQGEQLDRDIIIPEKRLPWVNYLVRFTFPALLFSFKGHTQKSAMGKTETTICNSSNVIGDTISLPINFPFKFLVHGKVMDENNEPIAGASVMLKGTSKGTITDNSGAFALNIDLNKEGILLISYIGYETAEVKPSQNNILVRLDLKKVQMEDLVVVSYNTRSKTMGLTGVFYKKVSSNVPLIKCIKDSIIRKFTVYPNPAPSGSLLNIELNGIETGDYSILLINLTGVVIKEEKVEINESKAPLPFHLNNVGSGAYFIKLTNTKNGRYNVQKVIVH